MSVHKYANGGIGSARLASFGTVSGGIVAVLISVFLCIGVVPSALAAPQPPTGMDHRPMIVVNGETTQGHTFRAYKIADYQNVTTENGKPVNLELATLSGGHNIDGNTLSDGTTVGGGASPLNFKQTLAWEIAAIDRMRGGTPPTPDAAGLLAGKDPLQWASAQWLSNVGENDSDPWLNTNTQTTGPFRTLIDWLEDQLSETESNECVAGTDPSCFGLYFDQETGEEYADGVSRAVFELDDTSDTEIGAVTPAHPNAYGSGLYIILHPHPQSTYGTPLTGTHAPAMILGTRIPVFTGGVSYFDLYNAAGTDVLHRLGVLNVKGDAVNISVTIDDAWKRDHPTFAMGDDVPFVITTNIPHYDNFLREGSGGDYEGGRTSGAAQSDGTPITNAFGDIAANVEYWTADSASRPANPPVLPSAATIGEEVRIRPGIFRDDQAATVFRAASAPKSPVRFDVVLDYLGSGLGDVNPQSMQVEVGSTVLPYRSSCVLGNANTSTPCFGFVQSGSNAQGERYFIVQIPDWVSRANGGETLSITYRQRLLLGAADDNGSIATKEKSYATAEFTSNSYMQDYSDFSDPRMYSTTTSQRHASVFSFPLTLSKVDSHSNKTLNAAEFTLSKGNDTQCFTVLGGIYHRSGNAPCGNGTVQTLASDASGQVRIKGLEAHVEYRVKESKQPEGYDPSNTDMVNFTVKVEPRYSDDEAPNEVLATEYLYAGASYLQPQGLPAYLRPATNEWVNDVDHVKHTFYAHEIDVLNGKTSQDVDAIAPFPWDTLAKTGAGVLLLLLVAGLLVLIGALTRRRKTEDSRQIHGVTA
jgi:hypothetical protein